MYPNFPLHKDGVVVAAVALASIAAATAVALPAIVGEDLMVYNPGPAAVYLLSGDATVKALATSMVVLAGERRAYSIRAKDTHVSAVSLGGAQSIIVWRGIGA